MARARTSGFTIVEHLVGIAIISLLLALVSPAIQSARERSRQTQCVSNLRQLGVACHNFESARGVIPGFLGRRPQRNPGPIQANLSVQAQLLPALGQQSLYASIDRREDGAGLSSDPPGSEFNHKLLNTPVPVFVCPSDRVARGGVSYRGCTGTSPGVHTTVPETEPDAAQAGAFLRFDGRPLATISDGLSQTALFSERLVGDGDASILTAATDIADMSRIPPQGWRFERPSDVVTGCRLISRADLPHWSYAGSTWLLGSSIHTLYNHILPPNSAIPDCGYAGNTGLHFQGAASGRSYHVGGVNVVFADGAARFINENVDISVWRAMGSVRGSEVVPKF